LGLHWFLQTLGKVFLVRQARHFQSSQDALRLGWDGIPRTVGCVLCREAAGNRDAIGTSASYEMLSAGALGY